MKKGKGVDQKVYLGDSVYARYNQFGELVLTTENGVGASNIIILEPTVLAELKYFLKIQKETKKHDSSLPNL
jgi:hypothetical protein